MERETKQLFDDLKLYGDRTSSFMTLYPGFMTYQSPHAPAGHIRFVETEYAWVAANEPLASATQKADLFEKFGSEAKELGKSTLMLPVTEELSRELTRRGYERIQIGTEPIFNLKAYFSGAKEPLDRFPSARALQRRGAKVREIAASEQTDVLTSELDALIRGWTSNLSGAPLGFLNQVDPWYLREHKKLFVLEYAGRIVAFLCAAPIFPKNGFFFADYICAPSSRTGTMELLFLEAMRLLHVQGYREARLGLCPLAQLDFAFAETRTQKRWMRLMNWAFRRWRVPVNFAAIYEFKAKLKPTYWEPLFLVAKSGFTLKTLIDVCRVHFPDGLRKAALTSTERLVRKYADPKVKLRDLPENKTELFSRLRVSLGLGTLLLAAPLLRSALPQIQVPLNLSLSQAISFLVLAPLLELALGSRLCFLIASVGFGLGSVSYTVAGALSTILAKPSRLLVPFALSGLILCMARQSWSSLHHLVALGSGVLFCALLIRIRSFQNLRHHKA